jgi:hypothetical protein
MAGEYLGLGTEHAAASSTDDDDTFVSLMQTIQSDVFQALQFIEQQHPTPAKAEATAKTVDWLKNKHQLQQVIRNLAATSENEPTPTTQTAFIDVIHAHSPLCPLQAWLVLPGLRALLRAVTMRLSRVHGALHDAQRLSDRLFGRKSEREQKQMEAIVRAAHGAVSAQKPLGGRFATRIVPGQYAWRFILPQRQQVQGYLGSCTQ